MQNMNKVLGGLQYVANFLDQPLRIGSIFLMDDRQFVLAYDFNDAFPKVDLKKLTNSGSKGTLTFSDEKDVTISFGGSVTSKLGKSEVSLEFKRAHSVAGAFNEVKVDSIRYGAILDQLREIWQGKGYDGHLRDYYFIFETITASSGTLIYSESSNNKVVLGHTLGEKVSKIADLGSGKFEYVTNSKRTLQIIQTTSHRPLLKAFRFKKNWEPEVLG